MMSHIPYEIPYGQKDMLKEAFSLMVWVGHRDIYYYSVNGNGLKEMEKYLDIKIKILR